MSKRRETERRFLSADIALVEVRAGADGQPTELAGYAAVFNQWTTIQDWWGEAWLECVAPGAYAKTIGEADIRALFNHDPNIVLGRNRAGTLELTEDGTGLRNVIRPPDNAWGRPVLDAVQRGDVTGQSIKFQVVQEKWERPQKRGDLAKRTIIEARLFDVGPVTFPAFEQTSVSARFDDPQHGERDGNMGVIGQAFRLIRLAEHGYPLAADERQAIGAAMTILRAWAAEPVGGNHAGHSDGQGDEPGRGDRGVAQLRYHSPATRARILELLSKQLEV